MLLPLFLKNYVPCSFCTHYAKAGRFQGRKIGNRVGPRSKKTFSLFFAKSLLPRLSTIRSPPSCGTAPQRYFCSKGIREAHTAGLALRTGISANGNTLSYLEKPWSVATRAKLAGLPIRLLGVYLGRSDRAAQNLCAVALEPPRRDIHRGGERSILRREDRKIRTNQLKQRVQVGSDAVQDTMHEGQRAR